MEHLVLNPQTTRLIMDIKNLDKKFRKSCDQILLLNNQIEELQVRYERAMKTNRRSFRYSLRLRLATLEGVRNMFYEYASRCADSLEQLQNQLVDAGGRDEVFQAADVEWEHVVSSDDDTLSDVAEDVVLEESTDSNQESVDGAENYLYDSASAGTSSSAEAVNEIENSDNSGDNNGENVISEENAYIDTVMTVNHSQLEVEATMPCVMPSMGPIISREHVQNSDTSQVQEEMDSENVLSESDANASVSTLITYPHAAETQK